MSGDRLILSICLFWCQIRRNHIQVRRHQLYPLLKDLNEKKQGFRRKVVSLAAELKESSRPPPFLQSFAKETTTRQACDFRYPHTHLHLFLREAESKAKNMEEQIYRLEKALEERNCQLESSASTSMELEKQRRTDQELKKRVLKLEFCLQEARAQTQKLQRMGERRDKALKGLHEQLAA